MLILGNEVPEHAQLTPREHGLARAWCALLEEDRALATAEQARAMAAEAESPSVYPLTARHGLHLLLQALAGELDRPAYEAAVASPASRLRWDRQFALFASAVLHGRAGVRVTQRRPGFDDIPPTLRAAGVTVREYEVFQLLARRLGNREIATRLHLSPRTVEKHVASLLAKTCLPNRTALSELAETTLSF